MKSKKKFPKVELFYLWDKNYKKLLIIPVFIFIINLLIILFVKPKLSYEFTGGYSFILETNLSYLQLKKILSNYSAVDIKFVGSNKYLIETSYDFNYNLSKLGKIESMAKIDPILGSEFFKIALIMVVIGFSLLIFVVFISFKEFIPGILMILSIVFDTLTVVAAMCLLKIPFSLATISILLLLIGYSIDTDILLTTRVLKHKILPLEERFKTAMITGLTEQFTAFTVMLIGYILVTTLFPVLEIVKQMTLMVLIGSVADMIFTWLFNASTLRIWVERNVKKVV